MEEAKARLRALFLLPDKGRRLAEVQGQNEVYFAAPPDDRTPAECDEAAFRKKYDLVHRNGAGRFVLTAAAHRLLAKWRRAEERHIKLRQPGGLLESYPCHCRLCKPSVAVAAATGPDRQLKDYARDRAQH